VSKGLSFAEARRLLQDFQSGTIIRPDQAKAAELESLKSEWQNIWTLRDNFLASALSGGQPATTATLDAAEALAKETMRRRLKDVVELAETTEAPLSPGARFVASMLGVELPKPKPTETPAPKLVTAH
jgi:hypothetical protein